MVDMFVLTMLSRPMKIDGKDYSVAWDCEKNVAVIVYTTPDNDQLNDLHDANGKRFEFATELEAHTYLLGMEKSK